MSASKNDPRDRIRPTRIVVVDDHPIVRERLAEVIDAEPDLTVCGEAESRQQALEVIAETKPDLAIIDLTLKESHGLDLIKDIRRRDSHLMMLVISMHDESVYAERVLFAGARGYITKQEASRNILAAIRRVVAGEIVVSEPIAQKVLQHVAGETPVKLRAAIEQLSDRELQVLELIGRGHSTRQIAETLRLEMKSVDTYRTRLRDKLGLLNASELLQYAIQWVRARG